MGNSESKPPLDQWSKDDVANAVAALGDGSKYKEYASSIREGGLDGGLLVSLQDQDDELQEILDELQVTSKIHRKVLTRALDAAKTSLVESTEKVETNEPSTRPSTATASTPVATNVTPKPTTESSFECKASILAAEKYGLTCYSPSSDVQAFDDISRKIMDQHPDAAYGGVHLVLRDGHHSISSQMRTIHGGCVPVDRATLGVVGHHDSFCSQLTMDPSCDFVIRESTPDLKALGETYVGHVIRNDKDERIGAICHLSTNSVQETENNAESLKRLSAEIAAMTEQQLRLRQQLVMRNASLQKQVDNAKRELALASNDIDQIQDMKEVHEQSGSFGTTKPPTDVPTTTDSSLLPFARMNLATEAEMEHLSPTFFEFLDSVGAPRPPIGKDDMARVARAEALGLRKMDPDGPMARQLKRALKTASATFQYPVVTFSVHLHSEQYEIGCHDSGLKVFETMDVQTHDKEGVPFCAAHVRSMSVCNYTIHKRNTFVVPDMWIDDAFNKSFNEKVGPLRAYVGTPIITSDGYAVASVCMMDTKPRYDFTNSHAVEFERLAVLLSQSIESWELRRMMDRLVEERKFLEHFKSSLGTADKKKREAPSDEVTFVLTDIQGSTALWEADCDAMKEALALHDKVLRKCSSQHNGYEIKTEGDAFHLAFHDPVDAIGFALQTQIELYEAPWSDSILALNDAASNEEGMFHGLRVRMGIHRGPSTPQINEVSGRASYYGETFRLTKSIEGLCHGGQILASAETWRMVSELREQLGNPQVVDYGEYVLATGKSISDGIMAKGVVQLVPKRLSFDYFRSSGTCEEGAVVPSARRGRQFPQARTKRRLTTSFLDAPNKNSKVTMMFVYPSGTDDFTDDLADGTFSILTKVVRSLLLKVSPPGYECQEDKGKWVIAFQSLAPAVNFGLLLMEAVGIAPFEEEVDRSSLVRVGIHSGVFSAMGPHPMTGRADYFGPVVNRAARVAAVTNPGNVYVGVAVSDSGEIPTPPDVGPEISLSFVDVKELKGVTTGMALFCCQDKVKRSVGLMLKESHIATDEPNEPEKHSSTSSQSTLKDVSTTLKQSFLGVFRGQKGKK